MKKAITIIIIFVLIGIAGVFYVMNKPYEPISFVVDEENFSASVSHGDTLILNLDNDNSCKKWSITSTPECCASDYSNITDTCSEFHIIAVTDGDGIMTFQSTSNDGTVENYQLSLSVSRHKKTYLQIDSVSFEKLNDEDIL